MAFQVSPGVSISEIDLTRSIQGVSLASAIFVGSFDSGPVDEITLISNEDELVATFGKPSLVPSAADSFHVAAQYLSYSDKLNVIRVVDETAGTGALNASSHNTNHPLVKSIDHFYDTYSATTRTDGDFIAKSPGTFGNSLSVAVCRADRDSISIPVVASSYDGATSTTTLTKDFQDYLIVGDRIELTIGGTTSIHVCTTVGATTTFSPAHTNTTTTDPTSITRLKHSRFQEVSGSMFGTVSVATPTTTQVTGTSTEFLSQFVSGTDVGDMIVINGIKRKVTAITDDSTLTVDAPFGISVTASKYSKEWEYAQYFENAPTTSFFGTQNQVKFDEVHIAVIDVNGVISGVPNNILEIFPNLSILAGSKRENGESIAIDSVLNRTSKYLFVYSSAFTSTSIFDNTTSTTGLNATSNEYQSFETSVVSLQGGQNGNEVTNADLQRGWDFFRYTEKVPRDLVITGAVDTVTSKYVLDNICTANADGVAFISPQESDVVGVASTSDITENIVNTVDTYSSTSFGMFDSGWKYMYDKYNDVYRYTPLNPDIAGLCSQVDSFVSPAGYSRGQIKNVVKLAYSPNQSERDVLYKARVNPVVTFPGEGTVLFGDKTLLSKPSAFDRVNVRRLFILLEKTIGTFSKYNLFDSNNESTRSQFVSSVEPFLSNIKGRGGIIDFRVICDTTNNTPDVIDRSEFVGSIFVKPTRSINFIKLNFVAVRTGVSFAEVVGI